MTDNRSKVTLDLSVNGAPSLSKAADAIAAVNQQLRDIGRSVSSAVKGLDNLEKSLAGVQRKGVNNVNNLTKATQQYYKVANTVKGQGVSLIPTTENPLLRNSLGQFQNQAKAADIATRALAHNRQELERLRASLGKVTAQNHTFGPPIIQAASFTQTLSQRFGDLNRRLNENADYLPRIRYAMYDVAAAAGIAGAAILALAAIPVKTAIQFERQFANVRRTTGVTGEAAQRLRQDLIELSQTVPISFEQITKIATLGGQLGIANTNIERFTETVAKFAATTDVTVEAAATAFGRLDALLDDVKGNYDALGSSILNVGINSVATESQIIAITSQISATGSQAGLAAHEIIGLAGSLASLGVAPEAARGTILRVFSRINAAVAGGGESLESFARVSGMTSERFAEDWHGDFTQTFLRFLEGVNAQGVSAETALRALGITAARDINTMLKLSQNFRDVGGYLELAKEGFEDSTMLGANFQIIVETVASKLEILTNNFQALFDAVGTSSLGPVGAFLDILNTVLSGLQKVMSNDVGQAVSGIAVALAAVAGAATLGAAGFAVATAGLLAFKTVSKSAIIETLGLTGAVNALGVAMKVALVGTLVGTAVVLLGTLAATVLQLSGAFDTATDKAQDYFGDISGLTDALRRDQAEATEAGDAFAYVTTKIKAASSATQPWIKELEEATDAQVHVADSLQDTNEYLTNQTFALRQNTKQWLANTLANDENIQKIFANRDDLSKYGFDPNEFISNILGSPETGAKDYVQRLYDSAIAEAKAKSDAGQLGSNPQRYLDLIADIDEQFRPALEAAEAYSIAIQAAAENTALMETVQQQLTATADGTYEIFGDATDQLLDQVKAIYEDTNAMKELADSLYGLGGAFRDNGAEAASKGSEIQAVIANIIKTSDTTGQAANTLQGFFDALVAGGYASAEQLGMLAQVIAMLGGATASTAFDMRPFTAGLKSAGKSAGGASKEVRTLLDYASDLQKIMSRSFDIRFGNRLEADGIISTFRDLNKELEEYQRKLQELTADKAIQEYFLSVAESYGDTLRAGVIRSNIADLEAEIADAQTVTNKTLVGNSEAAINNRKVITDLVKQYQDYIESLAASGASQATLRKAVASSRADFLAQAQALGFALPELNKYAKAFDDMNVAIDKVPRNITVQANVNPALQAFNELVAKARSAGASAGSSFGESMRQGIAKSAKALQIEASILNLREQFEKYKGTAYGNRILQSIKNYTAMLTSGRFAQGGAIHGPGTATSDSIPIWASDGEFMMRQKAVAALGTPLLNYMNKYGRIPGFAMGGQIGTASSTVLGGVVELGPKSLGILREAVNKEIGLYLDPMGVARLADKGHKQIAYGA